MVRVNDVALFGGGAQKRRLRAPGAQVVVVEQNQTFARVAGQGWRTFEFNAAICALSGLKMNRRF